MIRRLSLFALVACLATGSQAAAENILNNGGFESEIGFAFPNDGSNWSGFFGGPGDKFNNSTVSTGFTDPPRNGVPMPRTGDNSYFGEIVTGSDGFTGIVQTQPAIAGAEYTYDIWAKRDGLFNIGAEFRLEFSDADGNFTIGQFDLNTPIQDDLTEEYQLFSLTAVAPANTANVTAVIAVQTFVGPDDASTAIGSLFVDDASLTFIPEPTAALLACLGLGAMATRRR
ncbi:MAG: hypothetical protein AAF266_10265 [Planctomycetota bacterium]